MRTFKIGKKIEKRPKRGTLARKEFGNALCEGVRKARLVRSGLWDDSARKSRLVVYRVGEEPK